MRARCDVVQLETDLRTPSERGNFCNFYQTIVALVSEKLPLRGSGCDGSIQLAAVGNLNYPVAEETALYARWVVEFAEACRQISEWRGKFNCPPY